MIQEQIDKITEDRKAIQETICFNTSGVSDQLLNNLRNFYNSKLDNPGDDIHYNNMHRVVFYKTIEHTILALFLFDLDAGSFLVNEGYFNKEVKQLIDNYKHFLFEKKTDQVFQVYLENDMFDLKLRLKIIGSKYYVYGAIARDVSLISNAFEKTEQILYRFYFQNNDFLKELCYYDILPEINKSIEKIRNEALDQGQKLHLILIQIEPLKKYIKVAGDYLVNDIIRSVKTEINQLTGESGICHILNSRQYLIVTHGIDEAFIKEKFGHAHFRIKNLLLVYRLKYFEIQNLSEECNISVAWENLLLK